MTILLKTSYVEQVPPDRWSEKARRYWLSAATAWRPNIGAAFREGSHRLGFVVSKNLVPVLIACVFMLTPNTPANAQQATPKHIAAPSVIAHLMALDIHAVLQDARDQHALLVRHIEYYVGLVFPTASSQISPTVRGLTAPVSPS